MKLNQKMREIMPYYNQLYRSELLEYDPLKNVDNTLDHTGSYNDDNEVHYTDRDAGNVIDDGTNDYLPRHVETMHDGKKTTAINSSASRQGSTWTEFSDTPQGGLNGVRDGNYLTNATHVTDEPAFVGTDVTMDNNDPSTIEYNKNHKTTNNNEYSDLTTVHNNKATDITKTFNKDKDNTNGWDVHKDKQTGKIGTETYQEMVLKYRETFLNIDMMIINELGDLFMKVW